MFSERISNPRYDEEPRELGNWEPGIGELKTSQLIVGWLCGVGNYVKFRRQAFQNKVVKD